MQKEFLVTIECDTFDQIWEVFEDRVCRVINYDFDCNIEWTYPDE